MGLVGIAFRSGGREREREREREVIGFSGSRRANGLRVRKKAKKEEIWESKAAGVHHHHQTHHHPNTSHSHSLPPNPSPNSAKILATFFLFYTIYIIPYINLSYNITLYSIAKM